MKIFDSIYLDITLLHPPKIVYGYKNDYHRSQVFLGSHKLELFNSYQETLLFCMHEYYLYNINPKTGDERLWQPIQDIIPNLLGKLKVFWFTNNDVRQNLMQLGYQDWQTFEPFFEEENRAVTGRHVVVALMFTNLNDAVKFKLSYRQDDAVFQF
jgi:hypothetical protein